MAISIRTATIADAAMISALSKETFYAAFHAQNTKADMDMFLAQSFAVADTEHELSDGNHVFYLAYDGEVLMGYAVLRAGKPFLTYSSDEVIEISRLYLLPEFKGKGVGKLLMEQCLATAKQQHKKVIWLGVWEHNPHAIAFYQSFGFEKCGEHDFVLGTDVQTDWLMLKQL